ncbi:hypothetical protein [Halorussus halophilus]|uniref:hypothetical protein n=1 Tax=Halorussus halophilus TaxID=2650975 RepID=UPI001300EF90|nr:hypothetical protein [Halorussus halophilus]
MLERWLDYVFFAGLEISILGIPALIGLMYATPENEVKLAGLTAIAACSMAAATFRGEFVKLGDWPAAGDPYTMPLRSAYYSATIALAAYVGAIAHAETGVPGVGMAGATVVSIGAMAIVPRVVSGFRGLANRVASSRS